MRERGLKYIVWFCKTLQNWSLPMRERGLKYSESSMSEADFVSLPMRERGLKSRLEEGGKIIVIVAPHAGAWIEIYFLPRYLRQIPVAPHAGAWIEI